MLWTVVIPYYTLGESSHLDNGVLSVRSAHFWFIVSSDTGVRVCVGGAGGEGGNVGSNILETDLWKCVPFPLFSFKYKKVFQQESAVSTLSKQEVKTWPSSCKDVSSTLDHFFLWTNSTGCLNLERYQWRYGCHTSILLTALVNIRFFCKPIGWWVTLAIKLYNSY